MNKTIKKVIISITAIILILVTLTIMKNIPRTDLNKEETKKSIIISVFDKNYNNIYKEEIKTSKKYLIDVLEENQKINVVSEDSQYGEYITSIMGIEQGNDYYWSYYIDDEYATTGVSKCEIEENRHYSFKIEKFEY